MPQLFISPVQEWHTLPLLRRPCPVLSHLPMFPERDVNWKYLGEVNIPASEKRSAWCLTRPHLWPISHSPQRSEEDAD